MKQETRPESKIDINRNQISRICFLKMQKNKLGLRKETVFVRAFFFYFYDNSYRKGWKEEQAFY